MSEIVPINHKELWNEILKESEDQRREIEDYIRSKNPILDPPPHPVVDYLDKTVFPTLNQGLIKLLKKVQEQEKRTFTEGETYLNSLNFVAEYLWNMNPQHPERKSKWVDIYEIKWTF